MTTNQPCPDPSRLEELLGSVMPEKEQIELIEHLDGCADCQERLEQVVGGAKLLKGIRSESEDDSAARRAGLGSLITKLKSENAPTIAEDGEPTTDEISLDFLSPSENPEYLGRLGKYEIIEVAGQGGMGVVLKGYDPSLGRFVAIKVLKPAMASNGMARKRFLRAAKMAAAVSHDHVITIHAVDQVENMPILVMEYVVGVSLGERIERTGPLELDEILRIASQTAAGLAAAHAQGQVHRDIKPANILLENGVERVKITDFGLARIADDVRITQTGFVAGTPEYMSPEHPSGKADHRSDLFSLGSVMYAMCTGRSPFRAATIVDAIRRVCDDTPRPVREVNRDIPDWLAAIIDRLLAKNPDERFQSAEEVAKLLGDHLAHLQRPSDVPKPAAIATVAHSPAPREVRSLNYPKWTAAAAVLLLMGGIGYQLATNPADNLPSRSPVAAVPPDDVHNDPSSEETPLGPRSGSLRVQNDQDNVTFVVSGENQKDITFHKGKHDQGLRKGVYRVRAYRGDELIRDGTITIDKSRWRIYSWEYDKGGPLPPQRQPLVTLCDNLGGLHYGAAWAPDSKTLAVGRSSKGALWRYDGTAWSRGETLWGAAGKIQFARDDNLLISGIEGGDVLVWDAATGDLVSRSRVLESGTYSLAFAPGSKTLATTTTSGRLKLWNCSTLRDPSTWSQVADLVGHTCKIYDLRFSPDETILASAAESGVIRIWDVASGNGLHTLSGHTDKVYSIAFSPDGTTLASAGWDASVRLWDVKSGELIAVLPSRLSSLSVAFSPDGKLLAASDSQSLKLWDWKQKKLLSKFHAHWANIGGLAFSPDGKQLASAAADYSVKIWDVAELLEPETE